MANLSLFKLYQFSDRLPADWGVAQCPGVTVRKQCQDISSSHLLEPLRYVLPGSVQESEILDRLFNPFAKDGKGWKIETKTHLALTQWIGDDAPYNVLIEAKRQARTFRSMLDPIEQQVFHTLDEALKTIEALLPVSNYLP